MQDNLTTADNSFGRISELSLTIAPKKIEHLFFTAPYKILHPFHKQDFLQIMIIKVSAGIMAGDRQVFALAVEDNAKVDIISQSYEKIHQMASGKAIRKGRIIIGRHAVLFYAPLPVLPFAGSAFDSQIDIELRGATSQLFYADVLTAGRTARGECFQYRLYRSRVSIRQADKLIYADNLHFAPQAEKTDLSGLTQYEGYTHLGTCLLINFSLSENELRDFLQPYLTDRDCLIGVTTFTGHNLCIKILANGSEELVHLQTALKEKLAALLQNRKS